MSAGLEVLTVDDWLYPRLTGDATLNGLIGTRVYEGVAPIGTTSPWVMFSVQFTRDVFGVGRARYMTRSNVLVKAVSIGSSYDPLRPIVERVDALIQGAAGNVLPDGSIMLSCLRQEPVKFAETVQGQPYRHLGGVYEFLTQ